MPRSQVNKVVDGGPPDQDPVMASPISRPGSHCKPLDCDQEEDGWSRALKLSGIKSPNNKMVESMPRCMKAVSEDLIPENIDC